MSPTDPGWCVHEKELEPCMSKYDCGPQKQCMPLGKIAPAARVVCDAPDRF